MVKDILNNDWQGELEREFMKPYYRQLREFLKSEYGSREIYPPMHDIWTAFELTPYEEVKVVILGQDPYHGPGQAHGLSFSVKPGVRKPPSLRNVFKELKADIGCEEPEDGTLTGWAQQGVMMLNTVLTVRAGEANSHRGHGWETLTDEVIMKLSSREKPVVFVLWGKPAQQKKKLIDLSKHTVIESPHPSPLSANRGFFGSRPFSKVNEQLRKWKEDEIDWCRTKA
ncbi:uracil-DNA glycosylase [Edaphobacillus lindanitolerans]|uniref:Uracil-DNA glycosylase n=1 Tax=Edaphobacillus lindanitolerans TaxID=550447 RepID=A0A1U7PK65_9BACI|nr:uracil-DNA glycosylase [Edaphobacillus lindanitolerans]SIT70083.1 Uracil-DNA glycosylase [Edaphobacillus lindanitolerans]